MVSQNALEKNRMVAASNLPVAKLASYNVSLKMPAG